MTRRLTPEQASAAYDVLVECAGVSDKKWPRERFVRTLSADKHPCSEYRCGGLSGYGGIFRNDDQGIRIDCDFLSDRSQLAAIDRTNAALAALFGEGGA